MEDVKNLIATSTQQKEISKAPTGKLYTDPNGDFSFRYPEKYVYEKEPLVPGEMGGYALRFSIQDNSDSLRSFTIEKRNLDTYQVTVTGDIGCAYDKQTNTFKIASTFTGKTECDAISSHKNSNEVTYFRSLDRQDSSDGSSPILEDISFISEKKNIAVTLGHLKEGSSVLMFNGQDLENIISSFIFK